MSAYDVDGCYNARLVFIIAFHSWIVLFSPFLVLAHCFFFTKIGYFFVTGVAWV